MTVWPPPDPPFVPRLTAYQLERQREEWSAAVWGYGGSGEAYSGLWQYNARTLPVPLSPDRWAWRALGEWWRE